jgi:DNA repair exonuclease SbcCD ATPase subunit
LEKQINHQSIELKATQDDLSKAKAALDSARGEIETLIAQRDEARALSASSPSTSDRADEVERLKNELARTKDDMAAINDMLALTKASLSDMSQNHQIELEEAAKGRAEEVTALRIAHDKEVTALATHKSELLTRLSDLEGELATVKAPAVEPPVPPKSNGAAHSLAGVTKEELQRLHEAHNSKVHDLQADHDRAIKDLKEELEKTIAQAEALQQDVTRKVMEISYLEVEQEEAQDQITRYVGFFRLKSFAGAILALAVIYGFL